MAIVNVNSQKDLARLRRLALNAQGLLQIQPFGRGLEAARKAIAHIGYVQIDTISVVERAHNHVFRSRVPNFKPSMINQLLRNSDIFEYWAHAAAFLPIADFRFSLPYKHAIKNGQTHWYKTPDRKLMGELLSRIQSDGPLRSRDLEDNIIKRTGWWDLKPAKKALEQLYMEGELMVSNRDGFQKTYDLTERVLPSDVNTKNPSMEEFATHIVDQQLRCHALVSLKGLTYLRKNADLRKAVKTLVSERLSKGELEQIKVNDKELFFMQAGDFERKLPTLNNRLSILSPFDNSVIQRERLKTLFQFDYQIECYVPAAKRQYGYFCLPLLYRGEFIGRMDCKVHRKNHHLEIKYLSLEKQNVDKGLFILAFIKAIDNFCDFQKCQTVSLTVGHPKKLAGHLRSQLNKLSRAS